MYDSSAELKRLANSPVITTEDKVAALRAIAKKAKLSVLTQQFIGTVAGNRRAADLPGIISAFNDMLARRRGSQVAKVTSAAKLTAAQTTAIKSQLKKTLGRRSIRGHIVMDIRAAEISTILKQQIKGFGKEAKVSDVGQVLSVGEKATRLSVLAKSWTFLLVRASWVVL